MKVTGCIVEKSGKLYMKLSYKNEEGKNKQKWVATGLKSRNNKRRAEEMLTKLIAEYEREGLIGTGRTLLSEWFLKWIELVKDEVRPNTYRNYCGNMRNHIIPYFFDKQVSLEELTPVQLEDFYRSEMKTQGLSPTTIRHFHENINKSLEDAVKRGYIQSNPARKAKPPKAEKYRANFADLDEIANILHLFKGSVLEIPVALCAVYGLRRSEAVGLRWENVNFINRTITISETLQQGLGGNYRDGTKTESSYRTLPFTDSIDILLNKQLKDQKLFRDQFGASYKDSGYVCTWPDGRVVTPNYLSANFHKITKANNYSIRLHDLRHSSASNLLAMGFSIADVASWLGHSSTSTTLAFYTHVNVDRSRRGIADALNNALKT